MRKQNGADEKILELLELKFKEFERNPNALWMRYGRGMPICNLNGENYPGGSSFLIELFMAKKKHRIPVFAPFVNLKEQGLALKPNQRAAPIPLTRLIAVNNWSGVRLLYPEYNELSIPEKENYSLLLNTSIQYVFNVEQTSAERTHTALWNGWQEYYAGAPPDYKAQNLGYTELDCLIETMRPRYPGYFEEKPGTGLQTKYYCKCAQALAYLAYKSLPIAQNDTLRPEPKLALLISEIAGAFICAKYGLESFPNENFIANISAIRSLLSSQSPAFLFGQINRTGGAFERALNQQQNSNYVAQMSAKNLKEYMDRSPQVAKTIYNKHDLPGISIRAALKEARDKGTTNEMPDEGIAPKRRY